jgi:hypothetical protein
METPDLGKSWQAADGTALKTPLTDPKNPALVHDFEKDGHGREPSWSNLYFCRRDGTVFQLPEKMSGSHEKRC